METAVTKDTGLTRFIAHKASDYEPVLAAQDWTTGEQHRSRFSVSCRPLAPMTRPR